MPTVLGSLTPQAAFGGPRHIHCSLCHVVQLFVWLSLLGACEHQAEPYFLPSTWSSMNQWRTQQTSEQQEGDAPAGLRRPREIWFGVLPVVPFINFSSLLCSLVLTPPAGSLPRLHRATTLKVWLSIRVPPPHLPFTWRRQPARVHKRRHEPPTMGVKGWRKSGFLLQHLQSQALKGGELACFSCLPRTGVPTPGGGHRAASAPLGRSCCCPRWHVY